MQDFFDPAVDTTQKSWLEKNIIDPFVKAFQKQNVGAFGQSTLGRLGVLGKHVGKSLATGGMGFGVIGAMAKAAREQQALDIGSLYGDPELGDPEFDAAKGIVNDVYAGWRDISGYNDEPSYDNNERYPPIQGFANGGLVAPMINNYQGLNNQQGRNALTMGPSGPYSRTESALEDEPPEWTPVSEDAEVDAYFRRFPDAEQPFLDAQRRNPKWTREEWARRNWEDRQRADPNARWGPWDPEGIDKPVDPNAPIPPIPSKRPVSDEFYGNYNPAGGPYGDTKPWETSPDVQPPSMNYRGGPPGYNRGGLFRGSPGRDNNVVRLSDNEYVMKPEAVQKYGPQFMDAINNGQIKGYASGGLVNPYQRQVYDNEPQGPYKMSRSDNEPQGPFQYGPGGPRGAPGSQGGGWGDSTQGGQPGGGQGGYTRTMNANDPYVQPGDPRIGGQPGGGGSPYEGINDPLWAMGEQGRRDITGARDAGIRDVTGAVTAGREDLQGYGERSRADIQQYTDMARGDLSSYYGNARGDVTNYYDAARGDLSSYYGNARGDVTNYYDAARGDLTNYYNQGRTDLTNYYNQGRTDLMQGGQRAEGYYQPYREAGGRALDTLEQKMAAGPGDFESSPGYQFRLQQGMEQMERGAAARGGQAGLTDPRMQKELMQYGQGMASDEYDKFMNRYYQGLSPYQQMAGQGQMAAGGSADIAYGTGSNLSNIGMQTGGNLANMGMQTGSNLSNIGMQTGANLGNMGMQTGGNLANVAGQAGANLANMGMQTGTGLANMGMQGGQQNALLRAGAAGQTSQLGYNTAQTAAGNLLDKERLGTDWARIGLAETEAGAQRDWQTGQNVLDRDYGREMADKGIAFYNQNRGSNQNAGYINAGIGAAGTIAGNLPWGKWF